MEKEVLYNKNSIFKVILKKKVDGRFYILLEEVYRMSLTAIEWILLPEDEQQRRKDELSSHECFLLRTAYDHVHFSEEEKRNMSEEEKRKLLNHKEYTKEEKAEQAKQIEIIFREMF
ncbi:MAG: hypothetical protein HFJ09_11605 [Lachnospiraceae bacterium]|nr:hypothetical protein [Lachnospiraceae bacterium]